MLAAVSRPMKEAPMTTRFFAFLIPSFRVVTSEKSRRVKTLEELAPSTGILLAEAPVARRSLS